MLGRRGVVAVCVFALSGCTSSDDPPLAAECTAGAGAITRALADAPGEVRLADGTPLSGCVGGARSDSELQNLGLILTDVAESLEADAATEPDAALRLGYLIGAARRGAPGESSLQAELVHRLERSAAIPLSPAAQRALDEGMRAGGRRG